MLAAAAPLARAGVAKQRPRASGHL
jgi:hypothetical protein